MHSFSICDKMFNNFRVGKMCNSFRFFRPGVNLSCPFSILRGRCQDTNVTVNLAFNYESKCILLIEIQALKADRVTI